MVAALNSLRQPLALGLRISCSRSPQRCRLPTSNFPKGRTFVNVFIAQSLGGQKDGSVYPPLYEPTPTSELTTEQREMLQLGTALRNIGWLAFWSQLILTSVAAVILLFSTGVTTIGSKLSLNAMDICTLVGVGAGLFTTALSWTWIRAGRRLGMLQPIKVQQCLGSVLASVNINLVGMGAAIVGLQATVGTLVAKTLSTAAGGYYGPRMAPPPVAFDVFSVQACSNAIMAHFAGMVLAQWLVRIITRYIAQAEERAMMRPSAPTMPPTFG